jgi:urease gamma subunit
MSDREVRADAILKNLPAEALEDLWRMRHPEEGGQPMTLEAICVEIPRLYQVSCSMGALSNFYKWLRLKRRMEEAKSRSQQVVEELARDGRMSTEELMEAGQMVFASETLDNGNVKAFVQLLKIRNDSKRLEQESRRIALLEKKAELLDQAKTVSDDDALTPEEKAQRMKQIFRMG